MLGLSTTLVSSELKDVHPYTMWNESGTVTRPTNHAVFTEGDIPFTPTTIFKYLPRENRDSTSSYGGFGSRIENDPPWQLGYVGNFFCGDFTMYAWVNFSGTGETDPIFTFSDIQ